MGLLEKRVLLSIVTDTKKGKGGKTVNITKDVMFDPANINYFCDNTGKDETKTGIYNIKFGGEGVFAAMNYYCGAGYAEDLCAGDAFVPLEMFQPECPNDSGKKNKKCKTYIVNLCNIMCYTCCPDGTITVTFPRCTPDINSKEPKQEGDTHEIKLEEAGLLALFDACGMKPPVKKGDTKEVYAKMKDKPNTETPLKKKVVATMKDAPKGETKKVAKAGIEKFATKAAREVALSGGISEADLMKAAKEYYHKENKRFGKSNAKNLIKNEK